MDLVKEYENIFIATRPMLLVSAIVQQCRLTANANIKLWFANPRIPLPIYRCFGLGSDEECKKQGAEVAELFHKLTKMTITFDVKDSGIIFFLHCPVSILTAQKEWPLEEEYKSFDKPIELR